MRVTSRLGLVALFLSYTGIVSASETIRYVYDALGRLTMVDNRRTSGSGYLAEYGLDRAANRTVYRSTVVVGVGGLASGSVLNVGQSVVSPATGYRLTFQYDGNLVLYAGALEPKWSTNTFNPSNAWFHMQGDGNLVLYEGGAPVWSTGTFGHPGAYLKILDNGNLVVYDTSGSVLWSRA